MMRDKFTGEVHRIGVGTDLPPSIVGVKSYRDIIEDYATHPEATSLGPDGTVWGRQTIGLLRRRPVDMAELYYVEKESNQPKEAQMGLVHDPSEVLELHATKARREYQAFIGETSRAGKTMAEAASLWQKEKGAG